MILNLETDIKYKLPLCVVIKSANKGQRKQTTVKIAVRTNTSETKP